ncbi:hypothetical protein TNCV_1089231 [Trichonephila clavipes]|uniref:Uncharacterized protein n=1 Tax=Trichonephila clavipes TaxID=2585209 RepID=A0A8X6SNQ0_TRICX|nr:hypothetical protein TNCV_1089231 [Trichonephila clavipes]
MHGEPVEAQMPPVGVVGRRLLGNINSRLFPINSKKMYGIFKLDKKKDQRLGPAAKFEEKQFKTLNKETATHIGIREAEDWFRPIDLAKECDIYISSRSGSHKEIPITYGYTQDPFKNRSQNFKPKIKENYPQNLERENKNCFICGDSSHYARDYSPLVSMEIPLRTAYGQNGRCGMQPKPSSLRAQAQ